MKRLFLTIVTIFLVVNIALAQFAEPAVTGAIFTTNQVNTGQNTTLIVSFVNTGSTIIPLGSIELTISTAYNYYTTDGISVPTGVGAALFNWTYLGVLGSSDIWRGTNKIAIGAFAGGNISLNVTGNTTTVGFETTNINVQPVGNFNQFSDSESNNNLQPQLKINQLIIPIDCKVICVPFTITKLNTTR
ncbi:MAG: hypothetical protein V4585_04570 [Bacteroidota bacterium]|jgi:hypothetical protein